jgi:hypothetical protein
LYHCFSKSEPGTANYRLLKANCLLYGMEYPTLLTNTIGKTKDLTTKSISFNMQSQELVQEEKGNNKETDKN